MRPTPALDKDRRKVVLIENDKLPWVGARLGQALSKGLVWDELIHALSRAIQEVSAVTVPET